MLVPGRSVFAIAMTGLGILSLIYRDFVHNLFVVSESRATAQADTIARNGQRDFDFNIGRWQTKLRRLDSPLAGSTRWVEYEGTSVVRPLLGGDANLVELDVTGPEGRIEGVLLRLYDPQARQWSMHYASRRSGMLTAPVVGEFRAGRAEFHGQEVINGRTILVRFVIFDITRESAKFEQAYSSDGGRTWEVNWIAIDSRGNER
jgi:hypothetical protein